LLIAGLSDYTLHIHPRYCR